MTDNDIKIISEKIASLHEKILKSKFAESVTESEMMSLILAVRTINRLKAELEKHTPNKKHTEEKAMDYKFAGELAYRNGYEQGVKDFAKELESRCIKGGIYPIFVEANLKTILKEMTEKGR